MSHGYSYTASLAATAILAALTAFFIRRRRNPPPPLLPLPASCPLIFTPPLPLVAGHFLARSHVHSLCGDAFKFRAGFAFLLSGSNASALDELVQQCFKKSLLTTLNPRISTQHNSHRPSSDFLPDAPPPVISAATRAYVAELQKKCIIRTAFGFKRASHFVQVSEDSSPHYRHQQGTRQGRVRGCSLGQQHAGVALNITENVI